MGSEESKNEAAAANAEKQCSDSVKQWWLALQQEIGDEIEKVNNNAPTEDFLSKCDNSLQPLIDIVFFHYWNVGQNRGDGSERFIGEEQSLQLFEDLIRNNEGYCIGALTDYLKYKMYTGGAEQDAVKEKKTAFSDAAKKKATDAFDKKLKGDIETILQREEKACKGHFAKMKELEIAINKAKLFEVDLGTAEDTLKAAGEEKTAKEADATETQKSEIAKADEKHAKAVEAAKAKDEKAKEDSDKARATAEENAGKSADDEFMGEFRKAVDQVVEGMNAEYKKKSFTLRQAAGDAFLANAKDSKTFTALNLGRTLCMTDSEKFDEFATKLGFDPSAFQSAVDKIAIETEEKED